LETFTFQNKHKGPLLKLLSQNDGCQVSVTAMALVYPHRENKSNKLYGVRKVLLLMANKREKTEMVEQRLSIVHLPP